jgi:hypothetical protein
MICFNQIERQAEQRLENLSCLEHAVIVFIIMPVDSNDFFTLKFNLDALEDVK